MEVAAKAKELELEERMTVSLSNNMFHHYTKHWLRVWMAGEGGGACKYQLAVKMWFIC